MTRRPAASIVASPVLIGAVTLLVTIVAVFLAYNANTGLPFVPTYDIKAELPSGAKLDKVVEPLSADTSIRVRPRSALGLRFVQVTPGTSEETLRAGDTIPLEN